ncbi:methyltransferase domain-containing protein [Streptomyces poriferorum]|uniref:methyltransferase domain-containing protein n=2 Tax=Streptomyces poriferorum TaxID=2798799 RepID=UPI001C5FE7B3|nr:MULTISPECIES: methyltransferase domain-containing protein [Streptomyces]MBW5249667.1 methyltransferase domain-containing protein [Streptomyces poriferorum]MBW5256487.1 methyltransferase domain-containing protein [Streptomyces poriferorum]WLQ48377.1 methyltransferase domain-containing protein [Streptomyces sp. Alt1]
MDWHKPAAGLADSVTDPDSRWLAMVASVPRHQLVPRWWERDADSSGWVLRDGSSDPGRWLQVAYSDRSLITRVGALHADHARIGDRAHGRPTSSATMPSLVVRMLRHGRLGEGLSVLDLGTGSGGLTAYAARRIGDRHVTSLDVDSHLTRAAGERLAELGIHPHFVTADATEHVPGTYDRIVSTVGLPAGTGLRPLLGAMAPGGRIATTLGRTCLIVTGWKHANGDVVGRVEHDMAGFMVTRSGDDYPPELTYLLTAARTTDGEEVSTGRYPVVDVANAWELRSMLELTAPGVELTYEERDDRTRTACLVHPDGSWARASAVWTDPPEVHQSGPRKLWTTVERIRNRLNAEGSLPLLGAQVRITPDGVCHFSRGGWSASFGGDE